MWVAPVASKKAELLEVLAILVDEYENKHFPVAASDPIEAIKYRMEQLNLTQQDLAKYLGGKNRASRFFTNSIIERTRSIAGLIFPLFPGSKFLRRNRDFLCSPQTFPIYFPLFKQYKIHERLCRLILS